MINMLVQIQKFTASFLIVLIVVILTSCSVKSSDANKNISSSDDTLSSTLENTATSEDDTLVNFTYKRNVEEIDYNVYGIYITVHPTYDDNGNIITRQVFEGFIPRDKEYNPTLNCTIWYSASVLEDASALDNTDGMDATIRVRGNSSRGNDMKNFKVKLTESGDSVFGYDSLNINKHYVDETRAINKACMDLMQLLPENFISMETKFLHLYINDVDEDGNETGFVDQGIYTFVEQPNEDFLVNHGLDPNGSIYKAMAFEFLSYDEELVPEDDPAYDQEVYNEVIKPTANGDHDKLREMLDAVNNYSLDFNDVMAKYFDEENYLTWMSLNILLGNIDTLSHNFMLYTPSNSEKWYFLPWDFDGSLHDYTLTDMGINNYQTFGVHFYWTIPLHQRYFRIDGNLEKLSARIDEIRAAYITEENISYIQSKSLDVVLPFAQDIQSHENPILAGLYRKNEDLVEKVTYAINQWNVSVAYNYERYYLNLDNPTSGNIYEPVYENDEWVFRWDPSYDFQHEQITYDFYLATDAELENLIAVEYDLPTPIFTIDELPVGHVYFQYVAKDSSGHTQYPLNRLSIKDMDGNTLVRKRGIGHYDNGSGDKYVIENEIFGDDLEVVDNE